MNKEKIEIGDVVRMLKTDFTHYDGQISEVIGFKEGCTGHTNMLVQLENKNGNDGHEAYGRILLDGRKTNEMNLKHVYWVDEDKCEIVNKIKPEYPCYMKANSRSVSPGYIVKFTDKTTGSVVHLNGTTAYNIGYFSDTWDTCFDKITDEEFEKIKEEVERMKYKVLKNISGDTLREVGACRGELEKFIKDYGFFNVLNWTKEFEEHAETQNGWISFLLDKKFVEKIEQKLVYDSSLLYFYISSDKLFKVNCINYGSKFNLICISTEDTSYQTFDKTWEQINYFVDDCEIARSKVKGFDTLTEAVDWFANFKC